ncbi:hypothetical protein K8S19_05105 [bacterium]|nr:hypothetical protein [bacterium]
MLKLKCKNLSRLILLGLVLGLAVNANAKRECRSILGAHLTPVMEKSSLLWAIEGTMGPGRIGDKMITGGMLLGALNYTFFSSHQLYLEGGYKHWSVTDISGSDDSNQPAVLEYEDSRHVGLRQVFYHYQEKDIIARLGLQEMKMGNSILLDERVLGLSYNQSWQAFSVQAQAGTVTDHFARMGKFCANRHLYNLLALDYTGGVGEVMGETNLLGLTISWNPGYVPGDDAGNEFSEFSDSDSSGPVSHISVSNLSVLFYEEFGTIIEDNRVYVGLLMNGKLHNALDWAISGINQTIDSESTLAYTIELGKDFIYDSGALTSISVGYLGQSEWNGDAKFQPTFSNLFFGEVMRLDAVNLPLAFAEVRHRFPGKLKPYVQLKGVKQLEDQQTMEMNFEAGVSLFGHVEPAVILSRIEALGLEEVIHMVRLELKVAF